MASVKVKKSGSAAKKKAAAKNATPKRPAKKTEAKGPQRIVVPKPARGAYNPNRPLAGNQLLIDQIAHFRKVQRKVHPERFSGMAPEQIATEGQAAEYIRKMSAILHPQGGEK
ncbi:MAG: hypothetical protein ABI824_04770 [Acidobacteriota bacterium]